MKVRIKETGEEEVLEILNPDTGCDWFREFCQMAQQINDGVFVHDEKTDEYVIDQEDFLWWKKVAQEHEEIQRRIFYLKQAHGYEEIDEIVHSIQPCDLEDEPGLLKKILDRRFGKGL